MTDASALVSRLLARADEYEIQTRWEPTLLREAADTISALEADDKRKKEAHLVRLRVLHHTQVERDALVGWATDVHAIEVAIHGVLKERRARLDRDSTFLREYTNGEWDGDVQRIARSVLASFPVPEEKT